MWSQDREGRNMGARPSFALTEHEVIKLRNHLSELNNDLIYYYELLIKTGIRISEFKYLAQSWNKEKKNWLVIFIPKQSNRKGSNNIIQRTIKLPTLVFKALMNNDFELQELNEEAVKYIVNRIQKEALKCDISRKISGHDFRATFINMLKHRGFDIFDVKSITGHSNLRSLEIYFSRDTDVIEQGYDSLELDAYDTKHPKLLLKEINKLKLENKVLRERLKND